MLLVQLLSIWPPDRGTSLPAKPAPNRHDDDLDASTNTKARAATTRARRPATLSLHGRPLRTSTVTLHRRPDDVAAAPTVRVPATFPRLAQLHLARAASSSATSSFERHNLVVVAAPSHAPDYPRPPDERPAAAAPTRRAREWRTKRLALPRTPSPRPSGCRGADWRTRGADGAPAAPTKRRDGGRRTRGEAQRVAYARGGSPSVRVEEEGACLVGEDEGAGVYGEVWRRRVLEERPWARCPEWADVRAGVEAEEAAAAAAAGGGLCEERGGREEEGRRAAEGRREEVRARGLRWWEWDEARRREREGAFWIVRRGGAEEVRWMERTPDREEWLAFEQETNGQWGEDDETPYRMVDYEERRKRPDCSDWSVGAVLPFPMDSVGPSPASVVPKKMRSVSENWETYEETPSQAFDGRKEHGRNGVPPDIFAPRPIRQQFPPFAGLQSFEAGSLKDPQVPSQNVVRNDRVSRPRRLTVDPTPHRLAARTSKKHFRAMGHQAAFSSPPMRTIAATDLPLSGGFQINLRNEEESDPFAEPAPRDSFAKPAQYDSFAFTEEPSPVIQRVSAPSMDAIDNALTRIWDLYMVGNERARERLLKDLKLAVALQEMMGPNPDPPLPLPKGGFD